MDWKPKPPSRRTRIFYLVLLWIPGALFVGFMWVAAWWVALPLLLIGLWGTRDYLRRGDMFGPVDKELASLEKAGWELGGRDKRRPGE